MLFLFYTLFKNKVSAHFGDEVAFFLWLRKKSNITKGLRSVSFEQDSIVRQYEF